MQESMGVEEFNRIRGKVPDAKAQDISLGRITIWLPKLPKASHPNAGGNWRAKAEAKKTQKESAKLAAWQVMGLAKPWQAATVQVTYFTYRPTVDSDNVLAWCKASFDGLQGVVISNDSGFTYLPVQIEKIKAKDPQCGCIRLVITRTA